VERRRTKENQKSNQKTSLIKKHFFLIFNISTNTTKRKKHNFSRGIHPT
jgi:hypothetical protein